MRTTIRGGRVACIGFFLVISVTGCHTFEPSTPLIVHVRDAETQAPVPGATVRLWRFGSHSEERDQSVTTGADGSARHHVAPPDEGGVMVEVTATGYLAAQTTLPRDVTDALASAKPFQPYKGPPLEVTLDVFVGPRPVAELVVPVGYRGLVKAEIRVRTDGPWPAGQRAFTYTVPASGVVRLDGPPVFGQGVGPEIVAKFEDGTPVPKDAMNAEVALRWIRRDGTDVYFAVGTSADADAARRTLGAADTDHSQSVAPKDEQGGGRRGGGGGRGGRGGGRGMGGGMGGP